MFEITVIYLYNILSRTYIYYTLIYYKYKKANTIKRFFICNNPQKHKYGITDVGVGKKYSNILFYSNNVYVYLLYRNNIMY